MKLNKEQLLKINEINNFIIDYCDYFAEYEEELIYSEERIKEIIEEEEDIETIDFNFPGEEEYTSIEPDVLIGFENEIRSIKIVNNGLIKITKSFYDKN